MYILLQEALGDIVYAQLPEVDTQFEQMGKFVCLFVICILEVCLGLLWLGVLCPIVSNQSSTVLDYLE